MFRALPPAVLLLAFGAMPALAGTPTVPDIEAFMQIGYSGNPRISPDGRIIYFDSNSSGVNQVYRLDKGDRWPYQLTVFTEGVDFYTLSPTGESIICGVGLGGDENAQLWLIDARTGQAEALTASPEIRYGSPSWSSDGKTIFFNSNEANGKDFYIYKMDLTTGKKSVLLEMEGWNGPGDVSDDDEYVIVTHWDSNTNSDMYLVDTSRGRKIHLTPHEGEATFFAGQFDAGARKIYLISNNNEDGVGRRATIDLDSREFTWIDTEGPWQVQLLGISPDRRTMGWAVNEDGYVRLKVMDLVQERMLPAPPVDGQVSSFAFSREASMAFGFSSATSTADVWLWDWQAPSLEKITHSTYAGIDPSLFVPPQLVRYPAFDGMEIPGFLYLPADYAPGKPVPFVIHVHGGPESQFRPAFIRHFQYLILNGYGVFAPNVRGSAGYGKEYMDLDNYRLRLDSVKDLKAAADFLIAEGYTAPGMLAVKGGSYGGYMTLAAITEYPNMFSAAIDQVGIANFVSFLENTAEYRRHLREAEYGPLTDREFLESVSPLNKANLIETPLLVVHGENDPRVPVGEARQIVEAIENKGGQVEALIFADEGHGIAKRSNALIVYRKMVEFLDQHLKGEKQVP